MAFCIRCGAQLAEGTKFCNNCGAAQVGGGQAVPQMQPQSGMQYQKPQMLPQSGMQYQQPQMQQQYQQVTQQPGGKKSRKGLIIGLVCGGTALVAGIVVLILFLTGVIGGRGGDGNGGVASGIEKGDIITFGSYEQDGNTANGKEPVEWVVLDADAESVLVVSRYVLDCKSYHEEYTDVTWETCMLRSWLNNTFYSNAFSAEEQAQILETRLDNPGNEYWGTPGGNETSDRVFLLSVDEVRRYWTFNSWYDKDAFGHSEDLITEATPYTYASSPYTLVIFREDYEDYYKGEGYSEACIGRVGCAWWLRSPGYTNCYASFVRGNGIVGYHSPDSGVEGTDIGVRPALRLSR